MEPVDLLFDCLVVVSQLFHLSEAARRGFAEQVFHAQSLIHQALAGGQFLAREVESVLFTVENLVNDLLLQLFAILVLLK